MEWRGSACPIHFPWNVRLPAVAVSGLIGFVGIIVPHTIRLLAGTSYRLLLPLTRWLFEYSQENFRRQDRLNRVLFACIEELAIENARLRQTLAARSHTP